MDALRDFYDSYSTVINFIGLNAILGLSLYMTLACGLLSLANAAFRGARESGRDRGVSGQRGMTDQEPGKRDEENGARATARPLLEVRDLHVAYGRVEAVRGVSFSVPEGAIVILIGANGAGKTTTLAAISGVAPVRSGHILFRGEEITRLPSHAIVGRGIVQVPEGRQVIAYLTVEENLAMGAYQRRDGAGVRADRDAMYARFPVLRERRSVPAGSLSGGEQQMLAIARALMARPTMLLLDEPSMGLAPLLVNEIFRKDAEVHTEGKTILLVEQNARKALAVSDYAYVLETGRVTMAGSGAELAADERVEAAYLGGTVGTVE